MPAKKTPPPMAPVMLGGWKEATERAEELARDYLKAHAGDAIGARTADVLAVQARLCVEEAKAKNAVADFEAALEGRVACARREWEYLTNKERKRADDAEKQRSDMFREREEARREAIQADLGRDLAQMSCSTWAIAGLLAGGVIGAVLVGWLA